MSVHTDPEGASSFVPRHSGLVENPLPTLNPEPDTRYPVIHTLGLIVAAAWILGGTLFFLVRFSFVFYYANKNSIDAVFDRLSR